MPDERIADYFKARAQAREAAFTVHPSDEQLLDYLDAELDEALVEKLREHLTYCSRCAATLDVLVQASAIDTDQALADYREHPNPELEKFLNSANRTEPRLASPFNAKKLPIIQAALALAAALALGFWLGNRGTSRKASDLEPQSQAQNLFPLYLEANASSTRSETDLALQPGFDQVELNLIGVETAGSTIFSYELRNDAGRQWGAKGLILPPDGVFRILIPAKILQPGNWTIRLKSAEAVAFEASFEIEKSLKGP